MTQKNKGIQKETPRETSTSSKLIPTTFQVFGHEFKVIFTDSLVQDDEAVGMYRHNKHLITIQNNSNGAGMMESRQEQTFYHELVHCILDQMGEEKLYHNEKFVDLFSQCLHQMLKTAKY